MSSRRRRTCEAPRPSFHLFGLLFLCASIKVRPAAGLHANYGSHAAKRAIVRRQTPVDAERYRPCALFAAPKDDSSLREERPRERTKLRGRLPIISRTVPLGIFLDESDDGSGSGSGGAGGGSDGGEELTATVWEVEHPSEMMEMWWSAGATDKDKIGDPFGVVMWPGSILASREMARHRDEIRGKTVLLLGAGTGLEAQAAAMLGAGKVIATDINKLTLKLLNFGAEKAGLGNIVQSQVFDLFSEQNLPECDVVIAADILYNEMLGAQMGLRCTELLGRDDPPKIIVTDSQRFAGTDFLPFVNKVMEKWGEPQLGWVETVMERFTGSGMLIEGDQTYDVTVRILSIGWEKE
eukprot:CAMPEP_0113600328 /NCGR_PEP_ID=MMETSP0015_2-20120614/42648_1 /TAXON_ID=2838 /ORGANISM="Odontella" /LENGTH=351 /DNA_ID=CAMNT_0000508577 /DNA_START=37 /DNA_END=1092 /DNA_ORIENTATION=- /assembly_acc=CAM_ASM_000160